MVAKKKQKITMRTGAVVMMDALGFKGIWRDHDPEKVMKRLETLAENTKAYVKYVREHSAGKKGNIIDWFGVSFLSDTVAIALTTKPSDTPNTRPHPNEADRIKGLAVSFAAGMAGTLQGDALTGDPQFLYRGAIAYGKFVLTPDFLVGEAVDDAANHMNLADGGFVWAAPSALEVLRAIEDDPHSQLRPWPVPLKTGQKVRTYVVNPYFDARGDTGPRHPEQNIRDGAEKSFRKARSLDVYIKRENTMVFYGNTLEARRE